MKQTLVSNHFDSNGTPDGGQTYATGLSISWQRGPLGRGEERLAANGCFVETVISAAIDRLEYYQCSKFACESNALAIMRLTDALALMQQRTNEREARGVEGTHSV